MTPQDRRKRRLTVVAALALFAVASPSSAQPKTMDVAVAGGVGAGERAYLSSNPVTGQNVKLVFSLDTGNYIADVHVKVIASGGEVIVDGVARGPWVYATLPAGRYTVIATYANHKVTQQVTTTDHARRLAYFIWPASLEESASTDTGVSPILGTGLY